MRRAGRTALAALAAFVAVASLFRRTGPAPPPPPPPAPSPWSTASLPTDTTAQRLALRVAERGPTEAEAIGFVEEVNTGVKEHRLTLLAAGLAYYGFFTMFPLAIAAVSIFGLTGNPENAEELFEQIAAVFPEPTAEFLNSQLTALFTASSGGLGVATGVSLIATLWSASAATRALMRGIDVVHDQSTVGRGWAVRLWSLLSTLVVILLAVVLVTLAAILPTILNALGIEGGGANLVEWIRWPVLLVLMIAALTLLYRSTPASTIRSDGWISVGAILATLAIVVVTWGLTLVVTLGDYSEVYGTLTGLAVLMLWFYAGGLVVLVGAELDRVVNRRRRAGSGKAPVPG